MEVVIKCKTCLKKKTITTYPSRLKEGKGKYCSKECRVKAFAKNGKRLLEKHRFHATGEDHPNYGQEFTIEERISRSCKNRSTPIPIEEFDGFVRTENKKERIRFRETVANEVLERDDYICQKCDKRGVNLHVDHIKSWADYPDLRFEKDNCRTLCQKCHYQETFGREMPNEVTTWGNNLSQALHLE